MELYFLIDFDKLIKKNNKVDIVSNTFISILPAVFGWKTNYTSFQQTPFTIYITPEIETILRLTNAAFHIIVCKRC